MELGTQIPTTRRQTGYTAAMDVVIHKKESKMNAIETMEKYPDIFAEYFNGEAVTSCMVWGLETPETWLPIIDELCGAWLRYGWVKDGARKPKLIADQVKSKYGELRFYYHMEAYEGPEPDIAWYENVFDGMIAYAEYRIEQLED